MRGAGDWEPRGSATSFDGPRQIYVPPPRTLVLFGATGTGTVDFRVEMPDSRVRANVGVIGVPDPGQANNFLSLKNVKLWLRAVVDAKNGGMPIPITDLLGTQAAPATIPQSAGLGGYGREFVTAGDAIEGTITIGATGSTVAGELVLQVRYQPDSQRLPWAEWDEIKRVCSAQLLTPKLRAT